MKFKKSKTSTKGSRREFSMVETFYGSSVFLLSRYHPELSYAGLLSAFSSQCLFLCNILAFSVCRLCIADRPIYYRAQCMLLCGFSVVWFAILSQDFCVWSFGMAVSVFHVCPLAQARHHRERQWRKRALGFVLRLASHPVCHTHSSISCTLKIDSLASWIKILDMFLIYCVMPIILIYRVDHYINSITSDFLMSRRKSLPHASRSTNERRVNIIAIISMFCVFFLKL